jgi:hypothetical protein
MTNQLPYPLPAPWVVIHRYSDGEIGICTQVWGPFDTEELADDFADNLDADTTSIQLSLPPGVLALYLDCGDEDCTHPTCGSNPNPTLPTD